MKLHLPSGLRKALLACLAALALPTSLPSTLASASGIAAVLLFAGQEAFAADRPNTDEWKKLNGVEDGVIDGGYEPVLSENTVVRLPEDAGTLANGANTLDYTFTTGGTGVSVQFTGGASGRNPGAIYLRLTGAFEDVMLDAVGRYRDGAVFNKDISDFYVGNDAQFWFKDKSYTGTDALTTSFHIGATRFVTQWNNAFDNAALGIGNNVETTGDLILTGDAKITFEAGAGFTVREIGGEEYRLTLAATANNSIFSATTGGTLQALDLAANITLNLGADLKLKGDSTISGNITGDGNIELDKEGEITINSTGTNLQVLVNKLTFKEGLTVILNASGTNTVTIADSRLLSQYAFNAKNTTLTLQQGGTFGHESVLSQLTVQGDSLELKKGANLYLNRLNVETALLTLGADIYLEEQGSISCDLGGTGKVWLGDEAELTLGGDVDDFSRIQLQKGASSARLILTSTGEQNSEANFAAGINVCFNQSGGTGIDFKKAVTVRGDVEITDGTYVNFSETGDVKIDGELSGKGTLVFDRKGQTLTLGKGGSIGELQIKQGSAEIGGLLIGDSLVFGAGVTLTFEEGGSFGEMRMTESGKESHILLGGDLEVGSLTDASGTYSIEKAKRQTAPVHFVLGVEDQDDLGYLTSVEALEDEFESDRHTGLNVTAGVGIGFATSKVIELTDGGIMSRDFKFKGLDGTGTLKFSNVKDNVVFSKHLTLEAAHIEMAGGVLSITGGLILTGHNTLELTTATNGGASMTFGGTNGNFALSGDGELEIVVPLSALVGKRSGDIWLADFANWKNWQEDWARQVRVTFAEGMPYGDAAMDENGKLIWGAAIADDFTTFVYGTVEMNKDETSIKDNTVIGVTEDDIAGLTAKEGANLKLVAGKDGIGADGSGKADPSKDLSKLASVYFTGKSGYFVENGWFGVNGPGTIYVRDTQLYFSGKEGNKDDLTNLKSNFVIGGSQHGAEDVGQAALALSKSVKTTGSLTLKEDATIAFLLEGTKGASMSFDGAVNGSGKTLTLSEKGTGTSQTTGLMLNGGGTLGKLVSKGENVRVELGTRGTLTLEQGGTIAGTLKGDGKAGLNVAGGTLEVGKLSGSLSSLTLGEKARMTVTTLESGSSSLSKLQLGANSELRIGGDITLSSSFTWGSGAKLTLAGQSKLTLTELTLNAGSGKLTIDLTQEEVDKGGYQLFDTGWAQLAQWSNFFNITIDGVSYSSMGYTVDLRTGQITKGTVNYDVPPQIGPKLGYTVKSTITVPKTERNLDPANVKYDVNLTSPGELRITFNENTLADGSVKRSNLWLNVTGGENFTLNIAGLRADTLLVRKETDVPQHNTITLTETGSGSGDTSGMLGLKHLYVEGYQLFQLGRSFGELERDGDGNVIYRDDGTESYTVSTDLHLNTTEWISTDGGSRCSFFVGASVARNASFATNGKLYVGDYDLEGKEDESKLSEEERKALEANQSGARLGVTTSLTVDSVWGTNMQLWGYGTLTLSNGGRLYGELQIFGNSDNGRGATLIINSQELHVRKGSKRSEDLPNLQKLVLGHEKEDGTVTSASFRMDSGTLYTDEIQMVGSGSYLQFTLDDGKKDEAILSLGSGGFTGEYTPRIVLGGDGDADHYQLFSDSTEDNGWWGDWYVEYLRQPESKIGFDTSKIAGVVGKRVKLSYDGRIHFVDDPNELTLVWEGAGDESKILEWKTSGSAEWTQFGGKKVAWSELEGYVYVQEKKWIGGGRDAWLRGNAGALYDVLLQEDVITGDLFVDGATYTLKKDEGSKLIVSGALITQNGGVLVIGDGVTVAPRHYAGDGAVQLLDGGTLNLGADSFSDINGEALEVKGCTSPSLTLSLIVGERTTGTGTSTPNEGGVIMVDNSKTLNIQQVSGTGDLIIDSNADGATINLNFKSGTLGSLNERDKRTKNLRVNFTVSDSLEFLRESAVKGDATFGEGSKVTTGEDLSIGGVATFNDGSKFMMGGDLSVGLLSGGSATAGLETGVEITAANDQKEHTLHLTGGSSSGNYWGTFVLGSEQKSVNMDVKLLGPEYVQGFGNHDVTIWGDLTLTNGILQFSSDNVVIHGTVTADGTDLDVGYRATLSLVGTKSFTIDGQNGYAGYVQILRFDNDTAAGNAGSILKLGGDLEVGSIVYGGVESVGTTIYSGDSLRARHRVERSENAAAETVYVLLRNSDAVDEVETLQDYRNEYSEIDWETGNFVGVDLREGVGIGWAGEGELQLKGDGGTFTTPFKLKKGSLTWVEGTQTMTDFAAVKGTNLTISAGDLSLEQFRGELTGLTLTKGTTAEDVTTLRVGYGTLKAETLTVDGAGVGKAELEVNLGKETHLDFGSVTGPLQLQLTGWNDFEDQEEGYQLFDITAGEDSQWKELWKALGENWQETLIFLDDDGTEINSMVELTEDGVVRLRLEEGDLYWGATDEGPLTWSDENAWHREEKGGGETASFENGNRVHLEVHSEGAKEVTPKDVTLGSNAIAGSMDVQGAYTLTENAATPHTLTVQKELTVGGKGALTVNKGNRLVVKDYVDIEKGGSITLATDMVVGGNIGGGGKVKKAGADDVYVLWNNGGNGEITWKGNSWDTYVGDVLGNGVGYGKTGRTDLVIYGEAEKNAQGNATGKRKSISLGRNFKAEQGKTTFRSGLTLNGHKLVVGEDARIIVDGTDGLNGSKDIDLGYDGAEGGKGTIEITVSDALTNVTSDPGAELHINLNQTPATKDKPANTTLSGLELDGGLVLESGELVTFIGTNESVNGLDATEINGLVVVAAGSTTTLSGDVDIAHGLQVDGRIQASEDKGGANMTVHGGLTGGAVSSLTAAKLTLTGGADETKSYKGALTLTGDLDIRGGVFVFEGNGTNRLTVTGKVSSSDGGRLKLVYGDGLFQATGQGVLNFVNIGEGGLELELTGFSEKLLWDEHGDPTGTYRLFNRDSRLNTKLIHFTGWTEDEGLNPKKLELTPDGVVRLYDPASRMTGTYQAWVGERQESFDWTGTSTGWLQEDGKSHDYSKDAEGRADRKVYFVGTNNKEVTVNVKNGTISAAQGMSVLLGKGGLGGQYVFDMTSNLSVGGIGLIIGEDTHVKFDLGDNTTLSTSSVKVETGAVWEIDGSTSSSKMLGEVEIQEGGEVIIYQPDHWEVQDRQPLSKFKGKGKLTVDLSEYEGNHNFSTQFTEQLFHYNDGKTQDAIIEGNKLQTFKFIDAFIQLQGDGHMAAFKALKDVIVGKGSCLILDNDGSGANRWGFLNEENVNIHLVGDGYKEDNPTLAGNSVVNDAAFSFYTHNSYNGDNSTAQTVKTPWGFTLDDNATMRIGRDDEEGKKALAHVLQLGGAFNGNGHTLTKIGEGVLEFGFGCTVEEGSTGRIVVGNGTLKLSSVESSNGIGLRNYAVSVEDGTTLDMDNRDHSLGSLDVASNSEVLNIQGTTITINGYGDDEAKGSFGTSHTAENGDLFGTSWVMNWKDGEQTVKNAGSLNEVEVNAGKLVLDGVSRVTAARVNDGTLELKGGVEINTALEADGGQLVANNSLTLKDGMNGTLDKLTIKGGSADKIVLGGKGEKVLRAREVAANGEAAIQIDISGKTEPKVRLDFGAINGTLHLNLTGYSPEITEYQLFVNNNQYKDLWASAVLKSDESWWKDVLDIEVSGKDWHKDEMELRLTDDGVLHFLPFDGLIWNGTDPGDNVWRDTDTNPWKTSYGKNGDGLPAGKHVKFTDGDHTGTVLVDGMVTPKKVTILGGEYEFVQNPGTTGGLNIVQVEVKNGNNEDGSTDSVIDRDSGVLVVGDAAGDLPTKLTLALKNTSIPEIQLEDDGWLKLADDGALTNEDKVRGYKKTKLRFMGGTLDYSAYEGKTLKDLDVSVYVDKDDSRDAAKVHVSVTDYANGVVWGGREKAMTSGVGLALNGTGLELTGDGKFTLAWQETKGSTYGEGVTVNVGEKSTLTLDVGGTAQAELKDTFSGAGTLAVTRNSKLKLSGNSTGMGNIVLQDDFVVEIEGNNALGGSGTQLTLGDGGELSSKDDTRDNPTQVQAGTVTAAGAITVNGNITFTGKVTEEKGKEKSTSFTAAAGKTAGFSGDISDYHGTLVAPEASSTWHMTDKAAKGEVSVGLEGNGTFDFEVTDQLTLSVPDGWNEDDEETVKGTIGADGDKLTLKNSGAGNLIVASGTNQSGVKLGTGEDGRITLGKSGNDANGNDPIDWAGTDVQGNIVLANVTLAAGGCGNKKDAKTKIFVDTSVSPNKKLGGTVDVNGMNAEKLNGITVNEHGQLKGVTGTYTVGIGERREHYGLTLHFAMENEKEKGDTDAGIRDKELIQGRDGFTLDLSKAEDDLQFAFNASIIAQLRSRDEKEEKILKLHLLENGTITGAPDEVILENMKDQIAQLLWSVKAEIVQDSPNDWYLQLKGNTSNLYVVMDGEHSDLATVEDMVLFEGTDATAVLDGKTLTLNYDGKEKGKGDVTLHNLVGTEGTTLDLNNTGSGDDERLNVVLDNTHYGDAFNNDDKKRPLTGLTEEEKSQLHGQDTTFQGKILGEAGVDITKEGKGTLTVGDDYKLDDGTTKIEEGKLVLKGDENKMDKLEFAYTGEPGVGEPAESKPEERGLVLDGGAEGSKTTIGSIVESGKNSNGNNVELDNAELVLTGRSELGSTTITGNEEKGGGTVTVQGPNADVIFDGGKNPRMEGVDVNVKDGGKLKLENGAAMDVGDVTLSGKQGSSLDIGNGKSNLGSLTGDAASTLASSGGGELHVGKDGTGGGTFSGTLGSSSPDSKGKAGKLVVENGADFTLDNVTTTDNPTEAWDVQVGSGSNPGGSKLTIDTSKKDKDQSVTLGDVDLGSGNTTTFVVDPKRDTSKQPTPPEPALKGNSLKWGTDSTLVLKGDGAYQGDSLTLGSFSSTSGIPDDLKVELQGSAFFLKDKKPEPPSVKDGKLTVEFKEAEGNKFERLLPNMSKNADAGASMVWDSLKEKDSEDALMDLLRDPSSDYAKMANGLIAMYDNGDKENLEKALAAVAGSSISTLGPAFVQDLHRQLNAIRNRTTTMAGEVSYETYDKLPAWHAWLNAEGNYHKMDSDGFAPGYTLNNWGGTVGADVDVSPATTVGFALTAMYGDLKPDASDAATGDLDTTYLSAFARTTKGAWIHTFVVSAGMADVSLDRTVNVGGASYRTQGSTDGYAVGAMYEVGYTKLVNRKGTIALQPVFNVEIRHAAIKGYTETGSDAGLKVDDIEQDVVTFGIGARMQSIVGENFYNRTSILEARLLLKADVGDASGSSRNSIIGSAAVGEVESAEIGAFGVEAGVGLTVPLGSSRGSVFMDASAEVRSGWTSFNATAGYRISF